MAKPLNFNNIKKRYLTVTFADKDNTTIMVGTPTKETIDELTSLADILDDDDMQNEAIDQMYEICTKIMSHNKTNKKITRAFIDNCMDIEDITLFIRAYTEFIGEITNSKN